MIHFNSKKNNCNFGAKKYYFKMTALKMVKVYLYLILNEYFFFERGVDCSESIDFSFINEPTEGLGHIGERKEFFNNNQEKLSLKRRTEEQCGGQIKKSKPFYSDTPLPSYAESISVQTLNNVLEELLILSLKKFNYYFDTDLLKLKEDLEEMTDLLIAIEEKIIDIKIKRGPENYVSLKKFERFYRNKRNFYLDIWSTIDFINNEALELNENLISSYSKIQEMKQSGCHDDVHKILHNFIVELLEIIKDARFFFEKIESPSFPFEKDRKQARMILLFYLNIIEKLQMN